MLSRVAVLTLVLDVTTSVVTGRADETLWGGERLPSRAAILKKLDATPGKHLVMVRYTEEHPADNEWVYNGADIDGSKVIWAREMDPEQDEKLFEYYKARKIWLVNADELFPSLLPYSPPKEEGVSQEDRGRFPKSFSAKAR